MVGCVCFFYSLYIDVLDFEMIIYRIKPIMISILLNK